MTPLPSSSRPLFTVLAVALAAGCFGAGCGSGGGGGDPTTEMGVFIAFARDLTGFQQWTSFDLGEDDADGVMAVGHRRAYLNHVPPHGSVEFPVGTVIVKTIGEDQPAPGQTFAMAKRGGTYNAQGARGWEWFELINVTTATPAILWRGITPPAGEIYAGIKGGECNTCHAAGLENDFVPSSELLLSQF